MTRTANGIVSALCLISAALMLRYALTADALEPSTPPIAATTATAIQCQPFLERPLPIGSPMAARAAFERAAAIAFAPKRSRP